MVWDVLRGEDGDWVRGCVDHEVEGATPESGPGGRLGEGLWGEIGRVN